MNANFGRWCLRARAGVFAALGAVGTMSGGIASADPAPPFATLLRQAEASPRVAILDAGVAQAEGLADQARARPNPTISIYGENYGGSSPYGGFGRTETTLQYNHPFELGGKRASRISGQRHQLTGPDHHVRAHPGPVDIEKQVTFTVETALAARGTSTAG